MHFSYNSGQLMIKSILRTLTKSDSISIGFYRKVQIYFAEDFISVTANSMGSLYYFEYSFQPILLRVDCSNEQLGLAILEALSHSKQISINEFSENFESGFFREKYNEYIQYLVKRFNYKNKKQLFRTILSVSISEIDDEFQAISTHQDSLYGFSAEGQSCITLIKSSVSPSALGTFAREALSRCTSIYN